MPQTNNLLDVLARVKDHFVGLDNNCNITYANPAFACTFGLDASSIVGKNIWALLPKAVGTILYSNIKEAIEKKELKHFEWQGVYSKNFWEATIFPSKNGVTLISKDISERKKAEEALRQSEERFRIVAEAAKVMVYELDYENGKLNSVSGLEKLTGYSPEEVDLTIDWWKSLVHPDDAASSEEWIQKVSGNPELDSYQLEYRLRHKSGNYIIVKNTSKIVRDSSGKRIRSVGGVRDISKRRRTQEALRISMDRFKLLSETTAQLLSSDDPQAMVEDLCTALMHHLNCDCFASYLPDELSGKLKLNSHSGFPKEDFEKFQWLEYGTAVSGCVARSKKRIVACDIQYTQDKKIEFLKTLGLQAYACHPLIAQGKLVGTLAFGTKNRGKFGDDELELMRTVADQVSIAMQRITHEQELRTYASNMETLAKNRADQLKEAERLAAIGATAGMVGHDIRNPLQAIVSDVYLLKTDLTLMPDCYDAKTNAAESLESIEQNIAYINKIVADLQDYARPLNPEATYVDPAEVVQGIFETIKVPDGIKVSIDIKITPMLMTDPTFVRRALTNLIINAIQAMPHGGNLSISGYQKDDKTFVKVSDTGVGIPDRVKPKLFTPMMTTKSKGQGLGLAVVKRLVEALNGSVTFESQEGKGTEFTITLPTQN